MINNKNYIGMNSYDTYIFQEIDKNGLIRGFNGYCLVETVDGTKGLENVQWTHKETVSGITYETGNNPAPNLDLPEEIDGLYEISTVSCEACGACHDSESDVYGNASFVVINECEAYCKECVNGSDLLVKIDKTSDLFKAKNIDGVNLKDYEEIDTLFCDSSGFGSTSELALTKNQAEQRTAELMFEYGQLYAGITGIGQFQVYVTLYRKVA